MGSANGLNREVEIRHFFRDILDGAMLFGILCLIVAAVIVLKQKCRDSRHVRAIEVQTELHQMDCDSIYQEDFIIDAHCNSDCWAGPATSGEITILPNHFEVEIDLPQVGEDFLNEVYITPRIIKSSSYWEPVEIIW